jgi:hypothetical protein
MSKWTTPALHQDTVGNLCAEGGNVSSKRTGQAGEHRWLKGRLGAAAGAKGRGCRDVKLLQRPELREAYFGDYSPRQ